MPNNEHTIGRFPAIDLIVPSDDQPPDGPSPRPGEPPAGRIGVTGSIYYRGIGGRAASVPLRYGRWIQGAEQHYQRQIEVGPEWAPLDLGWFADKRVGLIVVSNPVPPLNPRVGMPLVDFDFGDPNDPPPPGYAVVGLELNLDPVVVAPFAVLPPGESVSWVPPKIDGVMIRAGGPTLVVVTIFPA